MVLDDDGDLGVDTRHGSVLRHRSENEEKRSEILEVFPNTVKPGDFTVKPVTVRPLPQDESWYETVWADWEKGSIFSGPPGRDQNADS